jgi:hypothetical protein
MRQSTVDKPIAFFRSYFRDRIELDKDEFISDILHEVVCGAPHEISDNMQIIKVLNAQGNWDKYSFGSHLRRTLNNEIVNSFDLMDEYISNNNYYDLSAEVKVINLSRSIDRIFSKEILDQYPYLTNVYDELKEYASSLLEEEQESSDEFVRPTFFRKKNGLTPKHIDSIYEFFKELGIVDWSDVKKNEFRQVFLAESLSQIEKPILFCGKSIVVCHALIAMRELFNNLEAKTVEKSGLFRTKSDHPITVSNLNACKSRLSKNENSKNREDAALITAFIKDMKSEIS